MQVNLDQLNDLYSKASRGDWKTFVSHNRNYIQNETSILVEASGWISELQEEFGIVEEDDATLIVALHNAWPEIARELEAGRRLAEKVEAISLRDNPVASMLGEDLPPGFRIAESCFHSYRDEVLTTYYESVK